jgi:hypothetical protein
LFPNEPLQGKPQKIVDAPGQRGGLVAIPPGESEQPQRMTVARKSGMNVQNAMAPLDAKSIYDQRATTKDTRRFVIGAQSQ